MFNIYNRRYTGSKYKLQDWIFSLVQENCQGTSFADLFAGTGIITARFLPTFQHLILNDLLTSNWIIYKGFFEPLPFRNSVLEDFCQLFQKYGGEDLPDNYVSKSYGNRFFNVLDARVIGNIRERIETSKTKLWEKEYYILLASLLYSVDRIANTVGHYDAYIRNKLLTPSFQFELIKPFNTIGKNIEIYKEDANNMAKSIEADICYIDPPYNSRQYSRFYHVLENIAEWKKPKLFGVACKPAPQNMSEYCRVKAPHAFSKLIGDLRTHYIIVSYNNTYNSQSSSSRNKITLEEIKDILSSKGIVTEYHTKHSYFNAGKTHFANHQELLFITRVTR